jgi:RimJ/RimL family protein N-acetyltransferase
MIDYQNYRAKELLKDGREMIIRPIRPDDKQALIEGSLRLSQRSLYLRFMGSRGELTEKELSYYTEVDLTSHVALVAVMNEQGESKLIGGCRYIAHDSSDPFIRAEVAFLVADEYQGQGVATKLFKHLIAIAQENGVSEFEADVLRENHGMLKVFERSGLPMHRSFESGVVHVTLSLTSVET